MGTRAAHITRRVRGGVGLRNAREDGAQMRSQLPHAPARSRSRTAAGYAAMMASTTSTGQLEFPHARWSGR